MLEGERVFLDGPFPATVLRLGGIYGPGRASLVEKVRAGEAACSPEPRWSNRIHRDDAAGALRHLMSLDAPKAVPEPPVRADAADPRRRGRGNKRCRGDRLAASGYQFRYPTFREGFGALLAEERGA